MTKKFFIKMFQPFLRLVFLNLTLIVANCFLQHLNSKISSLNFQATNDFLQTIKHWLDHLEIAINTIILVILVILLGLLFIELNYRYRHDRLANFIQSIRLTFHIRRILKRSTDHEAESTKKLKYFNQSARRSVADIRTSTILWRIKTPTDAQAIELIKNSLDTIREELTGLYPNFIYSKDSRQGKYLLIKGTKNNNFAGLAADRQAEALQKNDS